MDVRKSAIFTFQYTPNTKNGFRDSVLVGKCTTVTVGYAKISNVSIPSRQAMQVITMGRLYENEPLQNAFKRI